MKVENDSIGELPSTRRFSFDYFKRQLSKINLLSEKYISYKCLGNTNQIIFLRRGKNIKT